MSNRLPLAIFLSALVLFGYSLLNPPPKQEEDLNAGIEASIDAGAETPAPLEAPKPEALPVYEPSDASSVVKGTGDGQPLVLEIGGFPEDRGSFLASFVERGGALQSLRFRGFYTEVGLDESGRMDRENWLELLSSVETDAGTTGSLLLTTSPSSEDLVPGGLENVDWKLEQLPASEGVGVRFTYGPGNGLIFEKRVTFEPGTWRIHLQLAIRNQSYQSPPRTAQFRFLPAGIVPPELNERFYPEPSAIAIGFGDEKATKKSAPRLDESGPLGINMSQGGVVFTGVHNKYFAFLMRADGEVAQKSMLQPFYYPIKGLRTEDMLPEDKVAEYIGLRVPLSLTVPATGQSLESDYIIYAGPKDREDIQEDFAAHVALLEADLSSGSMCISFNSIGNGLLWFLQLLHGLTGDWGMSIILLTLAVRAALFPINRRSQTAMARYQKKMKRVTPRINEIKERYKNDAQKLREAQAKIMQEEKAFPPLGGCLPMFLQLPVFFGLFSMLRTSFDLRQQPFFSTWISDLSRPDHLALINIDLPLLGNVEYFNILPILMVVMWILQQKGMPQPQEEQAAKMQKMMAFMPIIFGFMLYNYAAGLSLYMLTSSTVAIFEQKVIKKKWPIDDTEVISDKKGGCGLFSGIAGKLAEKQKEQMKLVAQRQAQKAQKQKRKKH